MVKFLTTTRSSTNNHKQSRWQ